MNLDNYEIILQSNEINNIYKVHVIYIYKEQKKEIPKGQQELQVYEK